LDEAQLPVYTEWIHNSVRDVESATVSLKKMMEMPSRPTAVCCINDMCAVYALKAASELGISIPDQLSFISIDDILISSYVHPELTTVSYDKIEIGKETARLLIRMLDGKVAESMVISSNTIMERRSVASIL